MKTEFAKRTGNGAILGNGENYISLLDFDQYFYIGGFSRYKPRKTRDNKIKRWTTAENESIENRNESKVTRCHTFAARRDQTSKLRRRSRWLLGCRLTPQKLSGSVGLMSPLITWQKMQKGHRKLRSALISLQPS